jgi:hypothetical protein
MLAVTTWKTPELQTRMNAKRTSRSFLQWRERPGFGFHVLGGRIGCVPEF